MNTRYLVLPLSLSFALAAPQALALGLGQLRVKSGLNQPLVAEIPILSATQAELDQLDVRLASPDAFARVGLERPGQLTANLQFSLGKNERGQPVILVTTAGKFQEPLLSFLVEAEWGKGTVTREYTALIDPPYIAPAIIRPMTTPMIAAEAPVAPVAIVEPPVSAPEPAPAVAEATPIAAEPPKLQVQPSPPPPPVAAAPEPMPEPFTPVAPEPAPTPEPAPEAIAAAPEPAPEAIAAAPEPEPVAPPMPEPAPVPEAVPGEITVDRGQTLSAIASGVLPDDSVSLNQMMLALLRANPEAFDDENINRLKSGAVLRIPGRDDAVSLTPDQAAALVREQANAWRAPRQAVPQPAESLAAEDAPAVADTPAAEPAPAIAAKPPRSSRLEIVPPSGRAARGTQSGAAVGAGGTELRAELVEAKEDLAARNAEVSDLKTQIADLEKMNADRQNMIAVQDSNLKAMQERLAQLEAQQSGTTASAAAAPVPAGADAPAIAPAPAAPEAIPLYLNPYVLGGGTLVLIGGLVLLMRRKKAATDEIPEPTSRRLSDDVNLRASFAKTQVGVAVAPPAVVPVAAPVPVAAAPVVIAPPADPELDARLAAIASRPQDLEAHLNLLRLYHGRGDATDYEASAQAMRLQVASTMDPRWREAVIMGASLMPGHPLFSQAGWNSARVEPEPVRAPEPVADVVDVIEDHGDLSFDDVDGDGGAADDYATTTAQDFAPSDPVADDDASATRIELAKAYLDIGDLEGARSMLEEVLVEGGPSARATAEKILRELG